MFHAKDQDQRVRAVDEENLASVPGWELLTNVQKKFITLLPYFSSQSAAASYMGKDYRWVLNQKRTNVVFKGAVNHREWAPVAVARAFGADLMGKALFVIDDLMSPESKAPASVRLDAAKTVLRINGIHDVQKNDSGLNALFVNQNGGTPLFGEPPPKVTDVIPATSTIKEPDGDDDASDTNP